MKKNNTTAAVADRSAVPPRRLAFFTESVRTFAKKNTDELVMSQAGIETTEAVGPRPPAFNAGGPSTGELNKWNRQVKQLADRDRRGLIERGIERLIDQKVRDYLAGVARKDAEAKAAAAARVCPVCGESSPGGHRRRLLGDFAPGGTGMAIDSCLMCFLIAQDAVIEKARTPARERAVTRFLADSTTG